jgi:hypothetical protein
LIATQHFFIGPDKEAFHRYLADFRAVRNEAELLESLRDCPDVLPYPYTEMLALPPGSTYRDAVRLLVCSWTTTVCAPGENSFE